jgi:hypothetical protein
MDASPVDIAGGFSRTSNTHASIFGVFGVWKSELDTQLCRLEEMEHDSSDYTIEVSKVLERFTSIDYRTAPSEDEPLTPDKATKQRRHHPRCHTVAFNISST